MPGDDASNAPKAPPIWRGPSSLVPKRAEPPADEPPEPDEVEKASTLLYEPLPGQKPMTAAELQALYEGDSFGRPEVTETAGEDGPGHDDDDPDDGGYALVDD